MRMRNGSPPSFAQTSVSEPIGSTRSTIDLGLHRRAGDQLSPVMTCSGRMPSMAGPPDARGARELVAAQRQVKAAGVEHPVLQRALEEVHRRASR